MKKIKYIIPVAFCFVVNVVSAQTNYINHTLKAGETLSALAKQYNTNVGDIMRLNGMHAGTKLLYGSILKIPSVKTVQTQAAPVVEAKPVSNSFIHTVTKGETLFSISKKYNVSMAQLKTINKLAGNSVKVGSTLYISNETAPPSTANAAGKNKIAETVADEKKQISQNTGQTNTTSTPLNTNANAEKPQPSETQAQQVVENNNATAVEENTIQQNSVNSNAVMADQQNAVDAARDNNTTNTFNKNTDGYFADQFQKNKKQKNVSGISKTFKTASGWSDNKYYILANNIDPGTIVQLKADNGKSVYAKVLWGMGDMKQNNGADFRVSDATAAALNEKDDQFNLLVSY